MKRVYIVVLVLVVGCKTQFGLIHTMQSQSGTPIATTTQDDITITIEPFTEDTWIRLAESQFIDKSKGGRLPKIPFFLILIENKSSQPITIKEIAILYGTNRSPVYTLDELKNYLSSPAYQFIQIDELLTPQRLLTYKGKIQTINIAQDCVPCTLPFIPAGDTHCIVVAGKWIPVESRQFTVQVVIKHPDSEKIVDCIFIRNEYRTKGKHFLKEEH
ncbi:MAG: hypothetical protein AB1444_15255 [Spirochaetota bacterium]